MLPWAQLKVVRDRPIVVTQQGGIQRIDQGAHQRLALENGQVQGLESTIGQDEPRLREKPETAGGLQEEAHDVEVSADVLRPDAEQGKKGVQARPVPPPPQ